MRREMGLLRAHRMSKCEKCCPGILEEHAAARKLVDPDILDLVIVVSLALGDLLRCERHVIVKVEVAAVGRHPREAPTHALLIGLDLREWRARDRDEGHVMLHEMLVGAVDVIAQERATDATLFPVGPHHEVIDDQLAALVEQPASVRLPSGVSNTYSVSTFTQGSARRSAATRSRMRVSAFSLLRCALRAASHSSWDTIRLFCIARTVLLGAPV